MVIAGIFNKFFVNVSHDITKNIPRSYKSPVDFMGDRVGNSFFTAPSVPFEIADIISALKSGKSLGPNTTVSQRTSPYNLMPAKIMVSGAREPLLSSQKSADCASYGVASLVENSQ